MSASPSPLNGAVRGHGAERSAASGTVLPMRPEPLGPPGPSGVVGRDRKSTRLNSSHLR